MKQICVISFLTWMLFWASVQAYAQPALENVIEPKINGVTLDSSFQPSLVNSESRCGKSRTSLFTTSVPVHG